MHKSHTQFSDYLHASLDSVIASFCCKHVLDIPEFQEWPASTSKHHAYLGGLFEHTFEVVKAASAIIDTNKSCGKSLRNDIILTACVFHDFGKIYDYDRDGKTTWLKNAHYQKIHHVVKSYVYFLDAVRDSNLTYLIPWSGDTSHCILAHHGRLEYGSPVLPVTQEAWAVHLADMISVHCIESRVEVTNHHPRSQN